MTFTRFGLVALAVMALVLALAAHHATRSQQDAAVAVVAAVDAPAMAAAPTEDVMRDLKLYPSF